MKDDLNHVLTNLGFEPKEAAVYLALLELGKGSILEIARASGVNRASIYYIIEGMKKRGFVTQIEGSGGVHIYMPTDPRLLLAREKQHVKELEAVVPNLKALANNTGHRPSVRFFEELEGVKAIYEDTLSAKTEILNYANSQEIRDHWPNYDSEYVAKRAEKKIWLRGIAPDDDGGRRVQAEDPKFHREIRLIDPKKLPFNNEINIYDNKISMVSFIKPIFGVIIESKALAETQRSIFEMAWSFAGKADKIGS
ncbi:MAG: helix-turn-helix domain-containing protein [Patescibacteria group bacterium]